MRKLLPALLASLALISYGATAADPVKPRDPAPISPATKSEPGGSSTGPSQPSVESADPQEDERKATQAKEKMKKKPGYREDVPSPRASHTSLHANN
jgi:hypothetical protein